MNNVETLEKSLSGILISPEDRNYAEARSVYNGMIDKKPGLIVQCKNTSDIVEALKYAREHDMTIAVRGGGHSGPGFGTCEDGLVIDLSSMNNINVDPDQKTVLVGGGTLIKDMDEATHKFGLAVPAGVIASTGVGGLTLGGGHGYLTRKYGLTIDNLLEAEVVLANGQTVKANKDTNEDLFWAIRGGGGNFGIITSFLFQLHPVKNILGGPTFWPIEDSAEILKWYQNEVMRAPNELYGFYMVVDVVAAGGPRSQEARQRVSLLRLRHFLNTYTIKKGVG